MSVAQAELDKRNSAFWDTLCGTNLATQLGITDRSAASLKRFDDWFFDVYPYLDRHIPYREMSGKEVVEIGLGYGSLAQRIAERGAMYTGLDIADGPVEMTNYRLRLHRLNGRAARGSILHAPFRDATFDYVVAIGCFHHTGDLPRAVDESHRLLKPGGSLVFMVYNGLSYRQWHQDWKSTLIQALTSRAITGSEAMLARYDTAKGETAPHTDFVSRARLQRICRKFRSFRARLENITDEPPFARWTREQLLATPLPRLLGLDIYARAVK